MSPRVINVEVMWRVWKTENQYDFESPSGIMSTGRTIFISALFFAALSSVFPFDSKYFLKKPHVLPSAERALHAVYHELDTRDSKFPLMGQLYVALIEDQFTFGGDMEDWPDAKFYNKRHCRLFMATNVHRKCDDDYFLIHQDMVKLQKTDLTDQYTLDNICVANGREQKSGFTASEDPDHLLYRYKHRVLMAYKKNSNSIKCFGTYDTLTDTFTCMFNDKDKQDKPLVPLEIQNFLYSPKNGKFYRVSGEVEVYCKELHFAKD